MDRIYLDHSATTPLDSEILQKMLPYLTENYGNADSPHAFGRKAMNAVDNARDTLADLLGVKPNELYFTSGGTESDNWALRIGAYAMKEKGRVEILLPKIEHHAVLSTAEKLQSEGFTLTWIPVNERGVVELNALKGLISEKSGLVCVMYANNETGAVQPIKELAEIAHENGALFFTDGVQAFPHLKINIKELGVDMLSFSSHKFYGPKGCGGLYIRSGIKTQGLIVGGEQERGLRGGTTNVPAVVGMAEAYKKKEKLLEETQGKMEALRTLFLKEISGIAGVSVNGDGLPSLLNLRIEGVNGVDLVYNMDLKGVCISAGSACASASVKPSEALLAMGLDERQAKECIRIGFGRENTEEEILFATEKLKECIARLRG